MQQEYALDNFALTLGTRLTQLSTTSQYPLHPCYGKAVCLGYLASQSAYPIERPPPLFGLACLTQHPVQSPQNA